MSCHVPLPYLPSILRLVTYHSNLIAGLLRSFVRSNLKQTSPDACQIQNCPLHSPATTGLNTCDSRFLGMIGQRSRMSMSSPKLSAVRGAGWLRLTGCPVWPGATSTDGPLGVPFLAIQTSSCLAACSCNAAIMGPGTVSLQPCCKGMQ